MELDKRTIKAISSDTRVDIMKSLGHRRKMPSELSRETGLAASTVVEHLRKLESAGLVVRRNTGRKWIYYELTAKGRSLVRPKFPVQFVVMLSLGLFLMFGGLGSFVMSGYQAVAEAGPAGVLKAPVQDALQDIAPAAGLSMLALLSVTIGTVLAAYAAVRIWQRSRSR